jgi:hypothetical protein
MRARLARKEGVGGDEQGAGAMLGQAREDPLQLAIIARRRDPERRLVGDCGGLGVPALEIGARIARIDQ